jgi:hypothetical protein
VITGVVLARNEETNIVDCLRSLLPYVDELLLIDMESSDRTVELARPYATRILSHPVVADFDAARNIAISEARFEWLWFLDADERVPARTGEVIRQLVRERGSEIVAITIPFKSYFCGKWIEHCGWWPGYTMPRVLKRGRFRFSERLHGGVEFSGPAIRLPPDPELAIEHFSYRSIEQYVDKFNRYTSTEAGYLARQGQASCWQAAIRAMVHDLWLYYEEHQGYLDGEHGWVLSWLAGQYRWFSHAKLLDRAESVAPNVAPGRRTGAPPLRRPHPNQPRRRDPIDGRRIGDFALTGPAAAAGHRVAVADLGPQRLRGRYTVVPQSPGPRPTRTDCLRDPLERCDLCPA